jgi:hypothetical protein
MSILMGPEQATAMLRVGLALSLLGNGVMLGLILADIRADLLQAYTPAALLRTGVLVLGGEVLLPLLLLVVGGRLAMLGAVLLVLVAALVTRFEIVHLPHVLGRAAREKSTISASLSA